MTLCLVLLGACAPAQAPASQTPAEGSRDDEAQAQAQDEALGDTGEGVEAGETGEAESEASEGGGEGASSELDATTKAGLSETIRGYLPELQTCYEAELAKNPNLAGKMTYTITVERTGAVRGVVVDLDTVDDEGVRACTVSQIELWRFDGSQLEESADVTFSVAFQAV